MAKPTLDNIRSVGSFSQLFRWDFSFDSIPSGLGGSFGGFTSEDLNLRCVTSELPKLTGTSSEINLRGLKKKQPGIYAPPGPITIQFMETVDGAVSQAIKAWRDLCWNMQTGASVNTSELEATIRLTLLDQQDAGFMEYVLYGCYLEDYEAGGTLDGTTADPLRPSMVISYDYFEDTAL